MSWFENKKILVPWDFSKLSQQALHEALEMATSPDQVMVVHVTAILSANDPGMVWGTIDDETRREQLASKFNEMVSDLPEKPAFHVRFGDPGSEICRAAEELGCNCIVIPSHGRTGLQHFLIGSVAERVVRLAPCPVFVLRSS